MPPKDVARHSAEALQRRGGADNGCSGSDAKKSQKQRKLQLFFKIFCCKDNSENSPGGIRTCDQSVNSRPLYH